MKERNLIKEKLKEFENLDEAQVSGNLIIGENYYSFILLLALAIVFIFILFKFGIKSKSISNPVIQQGGELGRNSYYFILLLLLMILFVHFSPKFISFLKK